MGSGRSERFCVGSSRGRPYPMTRIRMKTLSCLAAACVLSSVVAASASEQTIGPDKAQWEKSRDRGVTYLKNSQKDDGSWTQPQAVGISALCTYGLLSAGVPGDDPTIAKALKNLETFAQEDGRICSAKSPVAGYETAIAVMAFSAANANGKYKDLIAKADKFLRGMQYDETKKVDKSDSRYGGVGYGPGGGRPDLSNTVFLMEALQAAGAKADDPAMQKALVFVSRCQNLESEFNTTPPAPKVNDGGFYYSVVAANNPGGKTDEGGLRSYGSMTYGGFKSMLYAGLDEKDPRVKAALSWIHKNYSVTENPGLGSTGLYYYYYLFAKALAATKKDYLEDAAGKKHDWRKELAEHLFSVQQENGSWLNTKSDRFFEGTPDLVTAYVLVVLKQCEPKKAQ